MLYGDQSIQNQRVQQLKDGVGRSCALSRLRARVATLTRLFSDIALTSPYVNLLSPTALRPLGGITTVPTLSTTNHKVGVRGTTSNLHAIVTRNVAITSAPYILLLKVPLPHGLRTSNTRSTFAHTLDRVRSSLHHSCIANICGSICLGRTFHPHTRHTTLSNGPINIIVIHIGRC